MIAYRIIDASAEIGDEWVGPIGAFGDYFGFVGGEIVTDYFGGKQHFDVTMIVFSCFGHDVYILGLKM
jgi:hypothetical protein